jgi:hypothetical protein
MALARAHAAGFAAGPPLGSAYTQPAKVGSLCFGSTTLEESPDPMNLTFAPAGAHR